MAKKTLICYFSCGGRTKERAQEIQTFLGGDLFEIKPAKAYSKEDLNWKDKESRSSLEMNDPSSRPEIQGLPENLQDYDRLLLGFPIWWGVAPHSVLSFLDRGDFSHLEIYPFATSGMSPVEPAVESLKKTYGDKLNVKEGKLLNTQVDQKDLDSWLGEK